MWESDFVIKNAVIEGTRLGTENHGILTFDIILDYGNGGHQGFGGFALDGFDKIKDKRVGSAYGTEAIRRVLEVVGVENWEDLKGKSVRAEAKHDKIKRLGNFLKDDWLDLSELAEEFKEELKKK